VIFGKWEKSKICRRKPRRIKDCNREPRGNFDKLFAKFTYKYLVGARFENQLRIDDNNKTVNSLHNFLAYIGQKCDTLTQFIINMQGKQRDR
jgi:hypothetical protein